MITKEIALTQPREMWHITAKNADGTPLRCRSNGGCKTWKTRPDDFKLPVKYGMYEYDYITPALARSWCLPERWEIEKFWRE